MWLSFSSMGLNTSAHNVSPMVHMYLLVMVSGPCQVCTNRLLSPLLCVGRDSHVTPLISSHPSINMVWHTALGPQKNHPFLPPSLHGEEGYPFPEFVAFHETVTCE